jgi:CRP-like cAMP-binding protein
MADLEQNLLLNSLSPARRSLLLAHSKVVHLPSKTMLYRAAEPPQYAYFMTSGVASVVTTLEDGESVEVVMIGYEGVVGSLHLLGAAVAQMQCFIQSEGSAIRVPFSDLQKSFRESTEVRDRVLEFVQSQALTLGQVAACHRLHTAEQRLARWLLMVRDRIQSDLLNLTQEFLGEMIGSRRTTVTQVAGALQREQLIEYSRGRVHILNGDGLEAASCNCYRVIKSINGGLYALPAASGAD